MTFAFNRLALVNFGFGSDEPFYQMARGSFDYRKDGLQLKKGDLLILEGGLDIDTQLYKEPRGKRTQTPNQTRDKVELDALKQAIELKVPIVGICRGAQLLTAFLGGKLVQDVTGHAGGHHHIVTSDGRVFSTSSVHHQMMRPKDIDQYEILAWSEGISHHYLDGKNEDCSADLDKDANKEIMEPEIVYYPTINALAIQGHPEYMHTNDPFVRYCRELVGNLLTSK